MYILQKIVIVPWRTIKVCIIPPPHMTSLEGGGGGVYTILVIGDWPVLFLVKRELAIFKNVNCDWINSGDW